MWNQTTIWFFQHGTQKLLLLVSSSTTTTTLLLSPHRIVIRWEHHCSKYDNDFFCDKIYKQPIFRSINICLKQRRYLEKNNNQKVPPYLFSSNSYIFLFIRVLFKEKWKITIIEAFLIHQSCVSVVWTWTWTMLDGWNR